jgi:hypothetical protein
VLAHKTQLVLLSVYMRLVVRAPEKRNCIDAGARRLQSFLVEYYVTRQGCSVLLIRASPCSFILVFETACARTCKGTEQTHGDFQLPILSSMNTSTTFGVRTRHGTEGVVLSFVSAIK